MSEQRGGQPMPAGEQELDAFVLLAQKLAAEMAEANFRSITAVSHWTMAQVKAETARAIERMEIVSGDILAAKGADPNSDDWRAIWTAMERRYRQTMAEFMRLAGVRGRGPFQ